MVLSAAEPPEQGYAATGKRGNELCKRAIEVVIYAYRVEEPVAYKAPNNDYRPLYPSWPILYTFVYCYPNRYMTRCPHFDLPSLRAIPPFPQGNSRKTAPIAFWWICLATLSGYISSLRPEGVNSGEQGKRFGGGGVNLRYK